MKVLHLFSNTKWTGPAEPVVNLCTALQRTGVEVVLACSEGSGGRDSPVAERARARGAALVKGLRLTKHFGIRHGVADIARLKRYMETERVQIVHTHLDNDHLLGGVAARLAENRPIVLRTSYRGEGLVGGLRTRVALARYTDGLITCSVNARSRDIERFGFPEDRVWTVYGAVDTHRFNPDADVPDIRKRFGLADDLFLVGVVARIQRHRKFDVLLAALSKAALQVAHLRSIIIGRGTRMREVLVKPARQLRLEERLVLPGYLTGADYVGALKAMDVLIFLVPGTDGTCRAVLEAMAAGKPAIVANRAVLPEVVRDGVDGLVVQDSPAELAKAIVRMSRDAARRSAFGSNARIKSVREFSLEAQAASIQRIYTLLLAARRANRD